MPQISSRGILFLCRTLNSIERPEVPDFMDTNLFLASGPPASIPLPPPGMGVFYNKAMACS